MLLNSCFSLHSTEFAIVKSRIRDLPNPYTASNTHVFKKKFEPRLVYVHCCFISSYEFLTLTLLYIYDLTITVTLRRKLFSRLQLRFQRTLLLSAFVISETFQSLQQKGLGMILLKNSGPPGAALFIS